LTLPELLVALVVLGLLAAMAFSTGAEPLARQRLEAATRRLEQGLQRARAEAQARGRACGLSLIGAAWGPPSTGALPPCRPGLEGLQEPIAAGVLRVEHNLPAVLRFTANGLVLDGGTVVLSTEGTALRRCLVLALPLGITRLGRDRGQGCEQDPTL
jgi:prepilin-type N-terminal cleavage/methylation domain-containing protein